MIINVSSSCLVAWSSVDLLGIARGLGNMLEAMNTGRYGQAAWQPVVAFGHRAVWWLGVLGGWDFVRVSVSTSDPRGNVNWCSSRMEGGSLLPRPVQVCSYRSILCLVERCTTSSH